MLTRKSRIGSALVLVFAVLLGTAGITSSHSVLGPFYSPAGDLDFSFGQGGRVTGDFSINGVANRLNEARAVAIQPDGKIVVVGNVQVSGQDYDFGLARYNPDGTLDANFGGSHGLSSTDFWFDRDDGAYALAIQPDGKIVVVGSAYYGASNAYYFAVARFNPNGFLDTTFGGSSPGPGRLGREWIAFRNDFGSETSQANAVAIQDDGDNSPRVNPGGF